MKTFKYVIINSYYPHVFSEVSTHDEYRGMNVTSAGFGNLFMEDGKLKVTVHGKSVSLGIESYKGDADIIRRLFVDTFWDE